MKFLSPLRETATLLRQFGQEGPDFPYQLDELGFWKTRPSLESGHFHGTEWIVPYGTPVHAIANGLIVASRLDDPKDPRVGKGLFIRQLLSAVGHDSWTIIYCYLSDSMVHPGQSVVAGDRIAYSGDTGNAGGTKLCLIMMNLRGEFQEINFREPER